MKANLEPTSSSINPESVTYVSDISRVLYWYNQEKEKKDARAYLKSWITSKFGKDKSKLIDHVQDNKIVLTYGWMARMLVNGCQFKSQEIEKFHLYVERLLDTPIEVKPQEVVAQPAVVRPTIRDYLEDKIREYLGELEGVIDELVTEQDTSFDLYKHMQANSIPAQYCSSIEAWVKRKAGEFIGVYETTDKEMKQAYDHISRRKQTAVIKLLSSWLQDLERYSQFKKANRKPRVKKAKPAGAQVAKMKYKREEPSLGLKSINPTEVVGASQAWIYNTKYKRLSVYRSDSRDGIQVKGSTLQNYDPSQCEQKTLRKPSETIKRLLDAGKVVLRKIMTEINSKDIPVTGRINEDCIIVRVIK